MAGHKTLLLGQADIARTMALSDYIEAVEGAFERLAAGRMSVPEVVHSPAPDGVFHVKSAGFVGDPSYVAVKVNGNFPDNLRRTGLPTIQGAIVLCDGQNGSLLAVIDSIEVTAMRKLSGFVFVHKHSCVVSVFRLAGSKPDLTQNCYICCTTCYSCIKSHTSF